MITKICSVKKSHIQACRKDGSGNIKTIIRSLLFIHLHHSLLCTCMFYKDPSHALICLVLCYFNNNSKTLDYVCFTGNLQPYRPINLLKYFYPRDRNIQYTKVLEHTGVIYSICLLSSFLVCQACFHVKCHHV